MSKIGSKKVNASFNGEKVVATLEQHVISSALAIEAMERLLISKGIIAPGDMERLVNDLIEEKTAPPKRSIQLLT